MPESRIPDFIDKSRDGISNWFSQMSIRDLLFHPDDAPGDIVQIANNEPTFSRLECEKLEAIIADMFNRFGDGVYESAYPFFMERMGLPLDSA